MPINQLGTAPSEVDDERLLVWKLRPACMDTDVNKISFLRTGNHLYRNAQNFLRSSDEFEVILCIAHSTGRNGSDP